MRPALTAENASSPLAPTGIEVSGPQPLPSWPKLLYPQQYAAPLVMRPQVCCPTPALSAENACPPVTATGGEGSESQPGAEPSPSWPRSFIPQQYAAPLMAIPQVCTLPPLNDWKVTLATLTVAVSLTPSLVAMTPADPRPTALTSPVASAVATAALSLVQAIGRPESTLPFASLRVAISCTLP